MLNLDGRINLDQALIESPNFSHRFSSEDLQRIGDYVWHGFSQDLASRSAWENRTQKAMDLAQQLQEEKSFPWPGASNVAFPLVTIACLQFHSRA